MSISDENDQEQSLLQFLRVTIEQMQWDLVYFHVKFMCIKGIVIAMPIKMKNTTFIEFYIFFIKW